MNGTEEDRAGKPGPGAASAGGSDPELARAVEEYRALLKAGQRPDRAAFLDRHPQLGGALAECLEALEFLQAAVPQLSGPAPDVAPGPAEGVQPGVPLGDYLLLREV